MYTTVIDSFEKPWAAAYMIGVPVRYWGTAWVHDPEHAFWDERFLMLERIREMKILRCLSILRTEFMVNYRRKCPAETSLHPRNSRQSYLTKISRIIPTACT